MVYIPNPPLIFALHFFSAHYSTNFGDGHMSVNFPTRARSIYAIMDMKKVYVRGNIGIFLTFLKNFELLSFVFFF